MAWNGSGTYVLSPTYSPEVNGTVIDAVRYNGLMTDLETALNNALCKDGQNAAEANISMGGYKLTSLAAGTVAGDAVRFEQVLRNGTAGLTAAATTELGASQASTLSITGTTTITSFGTTAETGQIKWLVFASATPITYNGTSMIIPGGASMTMAQGDVVAVVHLGSGNWKWLMYYPASLAIPYPNGSVSAPSITFAADMDTGFYRAGANSLGATAGGVLGMSIAYKNGTECTGSFKGDLGVTGAFTCGSFSPTSITNMTGSFTTVVAAGSTISIAGADYLSAENADPVGVTIKAGSASSFSKTGGSVAIYSGWGGNAAGTVSIYSAAPSVTNVDSGAISIYSGTAERDTGAISLVTGDSSGGATGDGTGAITIATGDGFDVGNIVIGTGVPSGTNNRGEIQLLSQDVEVAKITRERLSLTGSNPPTITSGAGTGASISGGKNRFIITCGTTPSATVVVTDNSIVAKPFYYWSGGVAAPRPVYGGLTDGSGVFTMVFPVAPSSGHKLYVYCLE